MYASTPRLGRHVLQGQNKDFSQNNRHLTHDGHLSTAKKLLIAFTLSKCTYFVQKIINNGMYIYLRVRYSND